MKNQRLFAPIIKGHSLPPHAARQTSYTWSVPRIKSFDDLLLSWNADRPQEGHFIISSSLFTQNQWSPWLLYAVWGAQSQYSFLDTAGDAPVHSFQDQIELLENEIATGFRIRIEACDGATLENFYHIYACASLLKAPQPTWSPPIHSLPSLPMQGLSQMCLDHPRKDNLCSPAATTTAVRYLLSGKELDPLKFAKNVYDAKFDIYCNWPFNVAQAFVELGPQWQCFCARSAGFEMISQHLTKNLPVVVSLKKKATRRRMPSSNNHQLVVRGYDASTKRVLCIDPAFPSDEQTMTGFKWEEFMQAWSEKSYLGYFFLPRENG
jgi:hypothetical protein